MPAGRLALLALAAFAVAALARPALAGGGPETTVVVVNADSPTSWRIANEYVRLRKIPATHVCTVSGVPTLQIVSVEAFRRRLWAPVKAFLEKSGFGDEIDVIAWSADFPYGVDFDEDKPTKELGVPWTPIASLSSMTYLARSVEAKDADAYLSPSSNGYYRRASDESAPPSRPVTAEEVAANIAAEEAIGKKDWAAAIKAFERLFQTYRQSGVAFYNYACCLARVSRPDDAMKALESASAAGFRDAALAENDADLESLRARDDFKALVARIRAAAGVGVQPTTGFRSKWAWTGDAAPQTQPAEGARERYWLSTLLAYTGEWGNSAPEALASLSSAAASDGTNPAGTFYFLLNDDVRSKTRQPLFDAAIAALRAMGRKAEVLEKGKDGQDGVVPQGKDDVLGAVLGIADFRWAAGKSRLVPGAIAEHLTSCGGEFCHAGQTKLSELIRSGAAGASGAVHEPYALQWKFPVPYLHAHYAAGASLAEAFYESVAGPYQLIVVGDPLARPFASLAKVTVQEPKEALSGPAGIEATILPADGKPVGDCELWVDGALVAHRKPGEAFDWDTTKAEDGEHELRVVAVEAGPVATRSFGLGRATVANGKSVATITAKRPSVPLDGDLALSGRAPGAAEVVVLAGLREIAREKVRGDAWTASVGAERLGLGTTTLQARALRSDGTAFRGPFLDVTVEPPAMRREPGASKLQPPKPPPKAGSKKGPATTPPAPIGTDGLECTLFGANKKPARPAFVIGSLGGTGVEAPRKAIEEAQKSAKEPFQEALIEGEFDVGPTASLFQLDVTVSGDLRIDVDGKELLLAKGATLDRQVYALANLDAGWHSIAIRYAPPPAAPPDLTILLAGDRVAAPLFGKSLRHGAGK